MVLVDSSVWIDFLRGAGTAEVAALEGLLRDGQVLLGDLMLVEVLQGCREGHDYRHARQLLMALPVVTIAGRVTALQAVENYRQLRRVGVTVRKTIDTLIATRCILDELNLLYSDRDFDPFVTHLGLRPYHGRAEAISPLDGS